MLLAAVAFVGAVVAEAATQLPYALTQHGIMFFFNGFAVFYFNQDHTPNSGRSCLASIWSLSPGG